MTLRRLTDDPSKARFGSMLRKARAESLSPAAERRIAAAVLAPSGALAKPPSSTLRAAATKGALGVTTVAIMAMFIVGSRMTESRAPAPPSSAAVPSSVASYPSPTRAPEDVALSVHDLPEAAAPSVRALAPSVADEDTLGAEAAFLRSVREDIAAHRGREALLKLDRYDARFRGRGAMGEEAAVERVEAFLQVGRAHEANALATRLLSANPGGPFARKLRSLMASPEAVDATTGDSTR